MKTEKPKLAVEEARFHVVPSFNTEFGPSSPYTYLAIPIKPPFDMKNRDMLPSSLMLTQKDVDRAWKAAKANIPTITLHRDDELHSRGSYRKPLRFRDIWLERVYEEYSDKLMWAAVAAGFALVAGGLVGFMLGSGKNDE